MTGHELRIRIEPGGDRFFRVFASGPTGEVTGTFELPFDERDVELFVLKMSRGRSATRRAESSEMRQITTFGRSLFDALFQARIGELYRVSRAVADRDETSLRVTLALTGVPELMRLPWEYLYDEPEFLAISRWTPVVRYLELPGGQRPLKVELPLRILAMVSSPEGVVALDSGHERENLERALHGLVDRGAVEITWLEDATLQALLRALQRVPFHIFHYIGHGEYDPQVEDGVLLLEDARERARRVTGRELGTILADHRTLRLAVLNACDGARAANDDPFAGVATSLVQRQIPAVIAMQFEITDSAAVLFAGDFYWKLADCGTVDTALAFARQAIYAAGNEVEWATPVLFMRVPDGRIFDVPEPPLDHPERDLDHAEPSGAAPPAEPAAAPLVDAEEPVRATTAPPPPSRRRRRRVAAAAVALVAGAALVTAIALVSRNGSPDAQPTEITPTGTETSPSPPRRWTLGAAIPASIRESCTSSAKSLMVPSTLTPIVDDDTGRRASFESSLACSTGSQPPFVQYSLASSIGDAVDYFQFRVNGAELGAFVRTREVCGKDEKASNNWKAAGPRANERRAIITDGEGHGRVLCYDRNGQWRIEWIDTRSRVYSFAQGSDQAALFQWWKTRAGPTAPGD